MVGVAGKSQACNTCRQRRVKCDLRRPSCLKCIKSKRTCTGYSRDLIFVNRTPACPSTTALSVLSGLRWHEKPKASSPGPVVEAGLRYLFSESSRDVRKYRSYVVELLEDIYLPKQSVSGGFGANTSEGGFSWVYRLPDLAQPSQSLDTSLFAFCLTQLHVTGTGNASLYQCLGQYNTALQHLHSDLDDSERRFREETLAAIIVLSTCELFVCPAETGWGVHARGISEILRLRDPGMANTPAWRNLFSRMRIVCTVEALTKREAEILENDIWRQIVTESGFSGPLDEIYQISADIPAILERATSLPSIGDRDVLLKRSAAVVQSILAMVKRVKIWHDAFWKASPTPRSWPVPSRATNPTDSGPSRKVFPFCFEFESLRVAVPVVMCWAVTTQMYSHVIQIYELVRERIDRQIGLEYLLAQADSAVSTTNSAKIPTTGTLPSTTYQGYSIQDIQSEGTRMARYICQSMEYYHRVEMGTFGSHAITYPSWCARQYFRLHPGHEREWAWLQNMRKMEGSDTRWGLSIMTFADNVEPLADLSGSGSGNTSLRQP